MGASLQAPSHQLSHPTQDEGPQVRQKVRRQEALQPQEEGLHPLGRGQGLDRHRRHEREEDLQVPRTHWWKALKPGSYRLTGQAADTAKNRSLPTNKKAFEIVK